LLNKERLINTFFQLVKIPSLSLKEREFSQFLKSRLEALGLEVYEDFAGEKIGGNSGNLIAIMDGEGEPFLISSHMDTVSPGENINPKIERDYIVSNKNTILGADDKAAIAAILEAITTIKENNMENRKVEFLFTISEEIGLLGAKNVDLSLLHAKEGYVLDGEGDVGTLILSAPYHDRFYLKIFGKASHAGTSPEKGINAILLASEFLLKLKWGRIEKDVTSNVGIIRGGRATNIVPDEVYLEGEFRSIDEDKLNIQWQNMEKELLALKDRGGSFDLKKENLYKGFSINPKETVVKRIEDVLNKMGKTPVFTYTMGGSDANILNSYGIRTVNVGIGMENVHSKEEKIKIDNLYDTSLLIFNLIKR